MSFKDVLRKYFIIMYGLSLAIFDIVSTILYTMDVPLKTVRVFHSIIIPLLLLTGVPSLFILELQKRSSRRKTENLVLLRIQELREAYRTDINKVQMYTRSLVLHGDEKCPYCLEGLHNAKERLDSYCAELKLLKEQFPKFFL